MDTFPFGVAHHMGLVPLALLLVLWILDVRRGPVWWWLAGAYAVSWVADSVAHVVDPGVVSIVYPVAQVLLVALALASVTEVAVVGLVLFMMLLQAITWYGMDGPDVLLRTVAFGTAVVVAWHRAPNRVIQLSLLATFGAGLVAWYGYSIWPGWTSWGLYQSTRFVGLVLFCVATWKPTPALGPVPTGLLHTQFR